MQFFEYNRIRMNVIKNSKIAKNIVLLVFFSLIGLSSGFALPELSQKPSIYHPIYPDLFVAYTTKEPHQMKKEYWLNQQSIPALEQVQIEPLASSFNLMLLIDQSNLYADKEAEGGKNHFLLELSSYLEENPQQIVSFLVNDNITSFDFTKENILALGSSNSSQARITDALALLSQQIRTKYNHAPFLTLVIGSGHNTGNIQSSFMPSGPILYFSSDSFPLSDTLLSFIIDSSGGYSARTPDLIDFSKIFQELYLSQQTQWKQLIHITFPWYLYRPINHFSLDKSSINSSITFPSPPMIVFFIISLCSLSLLIFLLIVVKLAKKKKKLKERNKNKHEFSTAFLNISHKEQRFEIRISKCEFILGNSNAADCMIDDFDLSASHCMIREKNGIHEIIDLNSRNGVWVNGIKIQKHILCDEDMISIGKTNILYRQGLMNYVSDKKIL